MKLNRLAQPQLEEISKINIPQIEKTNLDNGIPLWIMNTGSQELVKLQISIPAGIIYQNKSLLASFTNKLLKEGSKKYSASQMAERLDFYGAFLETKTTRDFAYINIFSLNKHLDAVLVMIVDMLIFPLFHQNELDVMLQQEKQAFQIRMQKVKNIAQRDFMHQIFGANHPYASSATLEDYENLKSSDLQSFFHDNYQVEKWHLFVSGKVENDIISILNTHFGALERKSKEAESILIKTEETVPSEDYFIDLPGNMQTALRMGCLSLDRKQEDYPVLALAQTIFGGYFGSRLMHNIREDKGYTYGIYSGIMHLQQASVFAISSELGSEVAQAALEEVKKELKILRSELVSEEELLLVKNYMSGYLLRSLNGPFSLGEMMRMIHENQLSDNYYSSHIAEIQKATAQDVLRVAEKYLDESKMLSVMVGTKM